ncbi:MYXO-CTERM sorting domain-containing protein [Pendulispora rubella]|uniref:MYXO-CTERM sorting domain-containing protein n=1 Tax=Pendulispora rubella TaxID=2741070 RepID=A0ABZ2KX64_9BACT
MDSKTPRPRCRFRHVLATFATATASILSLAPPARAYSISSAATDGCHESITSDALRNVRKARPQAAPIAPNRNERALIDDVQFSPDDDMKDLGAVALLLGVRDNDLKGEGAHDLSSLAPVHGTPENQKEHCLRGPDRKEPNGTSQAVDDCHGFIMQRVGEALDGLDAAGAPASDRRTSLTIHLAIRGQIDADLPTYYVRMGQAIHAVQDSFTHTYRRADQMQITVTLDWLDPVSRTHDEAQDGPPHSSELDECNNLDDLRQRRRALAIEASSAILDATLDPTKSRDQKLQAVRGLLDRYLGYSAGCTFENGWCDAPEKRYKTDVGCGCRSSSDGEGGGTLAVLAATVALAMLLRRRRRRRAMIGAGFAFASLLATSTARAESEPLPVAEPLPREVSKVALGVNVGVAGSFDKTAVAGNVGARLSVSKRWVFGLDVEWNPFLSAYGSTFRPGTLNAYASAMLRFPLAYESINLRTTLSAGSSTLLFDLYGAPRATTGIFAQIYPLGIEWKASRKFYVIFNPLGLALPVPQLAGVPFMYPQYRIACGLEFYP